MKNNHEAYEKSLEINKHRIKENMPAGRKHDEKSQEEKIKEEMQLIS